MMRKKLIKNYMLCMTALVLSVLNILYAKAADETGDRWFPVSVSCIEDRYKVMSKYYFGYNENGQLVQSPVKLSNLMDRMVEAKDYSEYLYYNEEGEKSIDNFLYATYGSDLETYKYSYADDGLKYEEKFPINTEVVDAYVEYLPSEVSAEDLLQAQIRLLEHIMYDSKYEYYGVIEYTGDYVTAFTVKVQWNDELWNKYLELKTEEGIESSENIREEYSKYIDQADADVNKYTYYYNLYDTIDVNDEEGHFLNMQCDEYWNTISYDNSYDSSGFGYFLKEDSANYYNGYDEYGNLAYRVKYSEHVSTSYDSPFKDSLMTDMFEFKTETIIRDIEQIDIYTYAYGNPGGYNMNPEEYELSSCGLSIADIVNTVGGDMSFVEGCTQEEDFLGGSGDMLLKKE